MADRYWVGGTAAWDATAGTKWATMSGGAGGAAVPTAADDVFFDAFSGTGTVTATLTNTTFKSIDFNGFTGTFTGTNGITASGNVTLSSGMTYTHTGTMTFNATATLITAGKTFSGVAVNNSGITVTLGDALNVATRTITVTAGTFNTANNAVTCGALSSTNSNARTISLGSSVVTINGNIDFTNATNLTFNAGTSQINLSSATSTITAGSGTFYNVSFTSTTAGTRALAGTITAFNDLTITGRGVAGGITVTLASNQVINGTLATSGTAGNQRIFLRSSATGVRRSVTLAAFSGSDIDFQDLIIFGAASPISGTRLGDRRGNEGITFSAPKTVYWTTTGGNWSADSWASISGGTPSTDNFPLPQDTAIVDNASAGGVNITNDGLNYVPTLDASARTSGFTINTSTGIEIYGSWILGSGVSVIGGGASYNFVGRNTQYLRTAGKDFFVHGFTINSIGGTVIFEDSVTLQYTGTAAVIVSNGTLDTNGYNLYGHSFDSSGSGVRFLKLRSSTISFGSFFTLDSNRNLTFDAGTSLIDVFQAGDFNGGARTFYNVSAKTVNGDNTFNNLTLPNGGTGLTTRSINGNQTVNGTFTCAGASILARNFVVSGTIGTPRTITAAAVSANNCDFRDIVIAGAAAPISPTGAGDCGGNSGITFDAPKTVYWNLAGTQNWNADAWATSSGGTPNVNNFPLPQDTAVFNDAGSAGTVNFGTAAYNFPAIDASARTSAMTLGHNGSQSLYGSYSLGSGVTVTGTSGQTFVGRTTHTITTAGKTVTFPITVGNGLQSTIVQLGDAYTSSSSITVTTGTFDTVNYTVTLNNFASSNSNTRTVKMGSGLWTLSGTGTVWDTGTSTNFFFDRGTAEILLSNTSTSARTFNGGDLSYSKLTIGGSTGTSTLTITGFNHFGELASTKTVAHTILFANNSETRVGTWSVTGTLGNVVTLNRVSSGSFTIFLQGSRTTGINYISANNCIASANANAEFYIGANSTISGGSGLINTAPPAARTLYWRGGTGNWNDTTKWSLLSGGAGGEPIPTSADNVIFDSASNATAYTVTINVLARFNQFTMAPPASGNVTLAGTSQLTCHGNFTLPASGLTRTYTGTILLGGSTTGLVFTTNGQSLASTIQPDGVGAGWTLGSSLTTTGGIASGNGSFDTGNYAVTAASFFSGGINRNTRAIVLGSSTVTLSGNDPFSFNGLTTGLTFNAGTSQVNLTSATPSLGGIPFTFYNVSFTNGAAGAKAINAAHTFNDLTFAGRTAAGVHNVSFAANQTISGTLTFSAGTSVLMRNFAISSALGTSRTLTVNSFSGTDIDFRDITIAGSAAPISPSSAGDCGANSGITFTSKTVYWNLAGTQNWNATGWASTSGGTPDINNFPLPQDTAVFDNAGAAGTVSFGAVAYNFPAIDASARTSAMTLGHNGAQTTYGGYTLGSGVTVSGTAALTFAKNGTSSIRTAGKTITFAIVIGIAGRTTTVVQLEDNLQSASGSGITLTAGTFDAVSYNVTCQFFIASNSNIRTLSMGSGLWTITGAGTVWSFTNSANATLNKGSADIIVTNSSTLRTFAGGGLSYNKFTVGPSSGSFSTSITGNNTFTELASITTVANTIALGGTTQRVGAWSISGTAGNIITITGETSRLIYTGTGSP